MTKSGDEFGFIVGVVEEGVVGVTVGTVVIGVVMSFWVVEIGEVNCGCFSSWTFALTCPIDILFVKVEPVLEV